MQHTQHTHSTRLISPACFDRYIGLPWLDKGRDLEGVDCWGLFRLVHAEELGVDLPSLSDTYVTTADRQAIEALISGGLSEWVPVPPGEERQFDGALVRCRGSDSHIGLVITPGVLLHIEEGRTSVAESYRSGLLKRRIICFYRLQATLN